MRVGLQTRMTAVVAAIVAVLATAIVLVTQTSSPAHAAGVCTGHLDKPFLQVNHNSAGVPTSREAGTIAYQTCVTNDSMTQELCVKFQIYAGGSTWYDYTSWSCGTNSGPSISRSAFVGCSKLGSALIRSVARGKVRVIKYDINETRYNYSNSVRPCA